MQDLVEASNAGAVANEPIGDLSNINSNLATLVGSDKVANLTALIQQLIREEINKILQNVETVKNLTTSIISSDDTNEKPLQVIVKQEQQPEKQSDQVAAGQPSEPQLNEAKPVYFLPRRPEYFAPPHPFFYGSQQPIPYYSQEPYPYYPRGEGRYDGPAQWRRINPTNDESLTDLEALAELEMLFNEKNGMSGDVEGRGLMSSISSSTNSAKSSFKSFINSISSAIPFSIVRKTYLVPGLAISG